MIEAVLFDLGDTLIHFKEAKSTKVLERGCRAGYDQLVAMGFSPPPWKTYIRTVKLRLVAAVIRSKLIRREVQLLHVLARCHARLGIRINKEQTEDIILRIVLPVLQEVITLDPEAAPALEALHEAGFKLGLVSNTLFPGYSIDEFLKSDGLLDYFSTRVYSSEIRYVKPDRRVFQIALDRIETTADRAVFVGDRVSKDVFGASRVGMRTVLLRPDGSILRGRVRPDHVIRSLSELPSILSAMQT